jgi:hypothetical protein
MWMELPISLQLRDGIRDDIVNILQLISCCFRIDEDCPVGEGVHDPEDDVKRGKMVESFLENVEGLREQGCIDEGEAEVDVGLPTTKSRVVLDTNGLDLFVVLLYCEG